MADIIVDTYKLNQYAQRIATVNNRINRLDRRLDSLYTRVGLLGLWNLMQADALTCYSWRLIRCQSYLQQTASDFENVERQLMNEDPIHFSNSAFESISAANMWFSASGVLSKPELKNATYSEKTTGSLWDLIKEEISDIPEDAKSAGEALGWIEKVYGKLPNCVTLGIDVLLPGSLKDAYTLTSGILQGDLTLEEGWDVAKDILSENSKLAVICETLDYTFEIGIKRSEEMEKQMYEQLGEGDILGAVFDGAEGFIDTIIGGSIDVLGDVAGGAVDAFLDKTSKKVPVVKNINRLTKYGTGLLGWNDGEGYSVGGLIGGATEKISEGLDVVTDVITDTTDVITDAVTDGFKCGINWVKSWFD